MNRVALLGLVLAATAYSRVHARDLWSETTFSESLQDAELHFARDRFWFFSPQSSSTSVDGKEWTPLREDFTGPLAYGGGKFLALSWSGEFLSSTNGAD